MSNRTKWSMFAAIAMAVVVLAAGVVTHAQEQKEQTPKLAKAGDTYSPTPAEVANPKGDGPTIPAPTPHNPQSTIFSLRPLLRPLRLCGYFLRRPPCAHDPQSPIHDQRSQKRPTEYLPHSAENGSPHFSRFRKKAHFTENSPSS